MIHRIGSAHRRYAAMGPTTAWFNRRPTDDPPAGREWYRIHNSLSSGGRAVIDVYGEIGYWGVESAQFASDLRALNADEIELHLNSPGGDIYEGIAIYNALVDHPAKVEVRIDGLAASIASVIAQAGNTIIIAPNAQMMVHDAWGMTVGNAAEMRRMADDLDRHSDNIASVYATRSGRGTAKSWRKVMEAETWYSADEAVAAGLADTVSKHGKRGDDPAATWRQEMTGFRYQGRASAPAPLLLPTRDEHVTIEPTSTSASNPAEVTISTVTVTNNTIVTTPPPAPPAAPEPAPVDPALVWAALMRHAEPAPAVGADVVAASIDAAAGTLSASNPIRDATQVSAPPPAPEPYRVEPAAPISSAELVLASTSVAAVSVDAEGGPIPQHGSSFTPAAPEPYIPPPAPVVSSAEWVLAATAAAASAPGPAGQPEPTDHTSDINESLRLGFLEVLIP